MFMFSVSANSNIEFDQNLIKPMEVRAIRNTHI